MKYAFIEDNQHLFSIARMCHVLTIEPSSYYDWLSRDIKCRRHKRFKVTTDSDHNKLVYPNVMAAAYNLELA